MAQREINKASYKPYDEKMAVTERVLLDEFNTIRAGRANPHLLDKITIDYYGTPTPLNQTATIQVPEARQITIQPWDPSHLKEIEKSLQASDLGINPQNDGKLIRLIFPALTEDRRKELSKEVSRMGEDAKVALRNVRREAIDTYRAYQKKGEISEDDLYNFEQEIQDLLDKHVKRVDEMVSDKEKELMQL